ncbi:DUF4902 domain-containing protein [Endothiovibrio diazotrophicus]
MLTVSEDGYIRLSLTEVRSTLLVHALSGLDEEGPNLALGVDRRCEISGYTEWVSLTKPAISLGWDWRLSLADERARYERVGAPRSNVMLLDALQRDIGQLASDTLIESIIDSIEWQAETAEAIRARYS